MVHRLINRTERLAAIERMLMHSHLGLRAVEIAEMCGVDRRTVYRDLTLLKEVGVPLYQKDGRFFINRDYYLAPVRLSTNEALALFLAARSYAQHGEQPNPHLVGALSKLDIAFPETLAEHVGAVAEDARLQPVDRGFITVLETLTRAWGERRRVKLWHSSVNSGETSAREFAPYFIETTPSGTLYVVGFDMLSQRVRAFNLRQIKRVKPLLSLYERPAARELLRYLAEGSVHEDDGLTHVVLLFSPAVAPRIRERAWHSAQRVELLDDGRCKMTVMAANWRDLLPWIRSWGPQVEVIEPQALREEMTHEAAQIGALYRRQAHI
ncbi:MAG: transcriptional regulator [Chloroflexi bacterium]|nr:transcriptional regulator [Chloroflexota bacterium]